MLKSMMLSCLLILPLVMVNGKCTKPRIRQSWDQMKKDGKTELYIQAVEDAVAGGFQNLFAAVHYQQRKNDQGHRSSAFLLWHRRLMLAYENMLRSLKPEYECLTVPYWNYFEEYETITAPGQPGDALAASSILRELPQGKSRRSDWSRLTHFPVALSIEILAIALDVPNFTLLSLSIQRSFHNMIHYWLGGTMRSFAAPDDPIFYSHHAMTDMAHTLYMECKVGSGKKDRDFYRNNSIVYEKYGSTLAPTLDDGFHMYYAIGNVAVHEHPELKPFFEGLPDVYLDYVDPSLLPEEFSYTYERSEFLDTLLTSMNCVEELTVADTSIMHDQTNVTASTNVTVSSPAPPENDILRALRKRKTKKRKRNKAEKYAAAMRRKMLKVKPTLSPEEMDFQLEMIQCVVHKEACGLEDYTDDFRQNFGIPSNEHAVCIDSFATYKASPNILVLDESTWRRIYKKYYL